MSGINLSKKYGVNPCIPRCFWCGEEKNEIVMFGKLVDKKTRKEIEAPMSAVVDYEPCDKCKENWNKGVVLLEVSHIPNCAGQPAIQEDAYPTGKYAVVKPEALIGDFRNGNKALVWDEDYEKMVIGN